MKTEEMFQRANHYISKCVIQGAEDVRRMLGLDKLPPTDESVRTYPTLVPSLTRTTPKRIPNV